MNFLEKDLETIIFETDNNFLLERGLDIDGIKRRQMHLGEYGVADIVVLSRRPIIFKDIAHSYQKSGFIVKVLELKKDVINVNSFLQAVGYAKGIDCYLKSRGIDNYDFEIVLIGKKVELGSSFVYLSDFIKSDSPLRFSRSIIDLSIITYDYQIDGLKFNHHCNYELKISKDERMFTNGHV